METHLKSVLTFTLTLTEEEAEWLNAVMQNPLLNINPDDEDSRDREMRYKFFDATSR